MAKGGQFERDTCKQLSLWWTGDEREDVFWRTSSSGGRATVRHRKGKTTSGHCGDVGATDSIGDPLLKLASIELKRGYSVSAQLGALLDHPRGAAQQPWEAWIQQATEASERACSYSWMIVARRDHRDALVIMDQFIVSKLKELDCFSGKPNPFCVVSADIRFKIQLDKKHFDYEIRKVRFSVMRWDSWLDCVEPADIEVILSRLNKDK